MKTIRILALLAWAGAIALSAPKAHADITNGLVGWWAFDESTPAVAVDSANVLDLNGTLKGTGPGPLVDQLGRVGTAYYLDGVSDYIQFVGSAGAGLIPATNDFSVFIWFYMPNLIQTTNAQGILFCCNNGQTGRANEGVQNITGTNRVYWFQNGGVSPPAYFGPAIASNQWYLLGVTRANGVFIGWLNTNQYILGTNNAPISAAADWVLGRQINGTSFFPGFVDDLRVYSRSLATNDVLELFNQPQGLMAVDSLSVQVTRSNLDLGTSQQARCWADFTTASNDVSVDVTLLASFQSDNGNVISITPGGLMKAISPGPANISATFSNQTGSVLVTASPLVTQLIHRYSFTSDAGDSVGANNGVLYGNATVANGALVLSSATGDFVDLGPNAISGLDEVSFEAWASFGANTAQCELFDFGDNDGVDGTTYIYVSPHTAALQMQMDMTSGNEQSTAVAPGILDGASNAYIAAVFNPLAGYLRLYVNGVLVAQNTNVTMQDLSQVADNFSYIGKSQFITDPGINMSVDEFRIYRGVLDPTNLAINAAAGPNALVSSPGSLQSVSLAIPSPLPEWSSVGAAFLGSFANVSGVNLANYAGISFTSSDSNVISVSAAGLVTAAAPGTATVTANYGGFQASQVVSVTPVPSARILVALSGSNSVAAYDAKGTNWRWAGTFASGAYAGKTLTTPEALAQDSAGVVYVGELITGGRILKFTTAGSFLGVIASEGTNFSGDPNFFAYGPDGNLYMSTALGTDPANMIDKITLPGGIVTTNIATTDNVNYTLLQPRGIAFGPDGYLYVCNRGSGTASGRQIQKFNTTNGTYVADFIDGLNAPNELIWDGANDRFLYSANQLSQIFAADTNGAPSLIFDDGASRSLIGLLSVGTNVFFSDYQNGIIAQVNNTNLARVMFNVTQPSVMMTLNAPTNVTLQVELVGNQTSLNWIGSGSLQSSSNVAGPYSDVPAAVSPYVIPAGTTQAFYRLRVR